MKQEVCGLCGGDVIRFEHAILRSMRGQCLGPDCLFNSGGGFDIDTFARLQSALAFDTPENRALVERIRSGEVSNAEDRELVDRLKPSTTDEIDVAIRVVARVNSQASYGHNPKLCGATAETLAALRTDKQDLTVEQNQQVPQ